MALYGGTKSLHEYSYGKERVRVTFTIQHNMEVNLRLKFTVSIALIKKLAEG